VHVHVPQREVDVPLNVAEQKRRDVNNKGNTAIKGIKGRKGTTDTKGMKGRKGTKRTTDTKDTDTKVCE
jgi:hypothetical protein